MIKIYSFGEHYQEHPEEYLNQAEYNKILKAFKKNYDADDQL